MAKRGYKRRTREDRLAIGKGAIEEFRLLGHPYVELREDGPRNMYYCILCNCRCYSPQCMSLHLASFRHGEAVEGAKTSLLGPAPWPFRDGVHFFPHYVPLEAGYERGPSIPGVLSVNQLSNLPLQFVGFGRAFIRCSKLEGETIVKQVWCEWLGKKHDGYLMDEAIANDCEVVVCPYFYDLGKKGIFDKIRRSHKNLLPDFSYIEDSFPTHPLYPRLLVDGYDNSLWYSREIIEKTVRKELEKEMGEAAERACNICLEKFIPGIDVATILNAKSNRLECCLQTLDGTFHLFHVSCLIHWLLMCEADIFANMGIECDECLYGGFHKERICSVFCADCPYKPFGKKPIYSSQSVMESKGLLKARKDWRMNPATGLDNLSIGLNLEEKSDQDATLPLRYVRFYKVHLDRWI